MIIERKRNGSVIEQRKNASNVTLLYITSVSWGSCHVREVRWVLMSRKTKPYGHIRTSIATKGKVGEGTRREKHLPDCADQVKRLTFRDSYYIGGEAGHRAYDLLVEGLMSKDRPMKSCPCNKNE